MVGSHLLDYLLEKTDWEIHGMLRWRSPLDIISSHLETVNVGGRIKLHYADLRDTMAIRMRPGGAARLPCFTSPPRATRKPPSPRRSRHHWDTNIQGTERLLGALRRFSRRKPSSTSAPRRKCSAACPAEKLPIDEECTFHPASPYAISKVGTDLVGRYYAEAYKMA